MIHKNIKKKQCTKCGEWKKLNSDNFYRSKSNKDGFMNLCKECSKKYDKKRNKEANNRCVDCGKLISRGKRSKRCKVCSCIGENNAFYGKKHTKESKMNMSISVSGENHRLYGKHIPLKTRKKMSIAMSGKRNPMYGKVGKKHHLFGTTIPEERKKKLSIINTGKKCSEKTKKLLSKKHSGKNNAFYGKHHTKESLIKMSESHKNPSIETRRKMSEARKNMSEKTRRNLSEAQTKYLSSSRSKGKGKTYDTKIEIKMENLLKQLGVKYYKQYNVENVACVDFFLPDYDVAVQCDGDYWHSKKINKGRDIAQDTVLEFKGYKIYRFWEHEINKSAVDCINRVEELKN